MLLSCPNCHLERDVDPSRIPAGSTIATCRKCGERFPLPGRVPAGTDRDRKPPAAERPAPLKLIKPSPAPGEPPDSTPRESLTYSGRGTALFKIQLTNILLTVLTLGIYGPWGKVKIRNYLYGSTGLMDERFAYTGTGKELFYGRLKATGILFVFTTIPRLMQDFLHPAFALVTFPATIVLISFAMVASRRYRLSRTVWHGVRFSFNGLTKEYLPVYIKGAFLVPLTLGFYSPYYHARNESFWRNNTFYGNRPINYTGEAADLKKGYLKAYLLSLPTLGLYWFWFKAELMRYDWEHTAFENTRFRFDITGGQLFAFTAVNALLTLTTLGLAYPLVQARYLKLLSEHLSISGGVEFSKLEQTAPTAKAVGDGMVGLLDMDIGF